MPGGVVELGETTRQTARREIREECGLEIEVGAVLDVVDNVIRDEESQVLYHYVMVDFIAEYVSGEAQASSDVSEVRWVGEDELDELDIPAKAIPILRRAFALAREE